MKVLLVGACGHMGAEILRLSGEGYKGAQVVAGVDPHPAGSCPVPCAASFCDVQETDIDCVVDFSSHLATKELLQFATCRGLPLVIATTGQTEEEKEAIVQASKEIPVFFAANFSLGVALLIELAKQTAMAFPEAEIEIIEKHHDRKVDAPSGTALAIAEAIRKVRPSNWIHSGRSGQAKRTKEEIGIHAIRMGNIVGEHEVIVGTGTQTITLKHEAHSRSLFAEGALTAAAYLVGKKSGLYDMERMLTE